MKKIASRICISILFLAGLSLLLYPLVANTWNNYRQDQLVSTYETVVRELEAADKIDYSKEWEQAHSYNDALYPMILPDSFAIAESREGEDSFYMSCLNLAGDGMMGQIEIPKIDVKIPIYHTTEVEVLEKAAGHLEGSSLPVGGADTHTVISAHRGLPSATLFTDLDKLELGDHFLIYVLDEILCYEVDQILTVEPDETEALSVVDGQDMATLLTCTPYGVNTHRLLVRGVRVDYDPVQVQEQEAAAEVVSLHTNYLVWVIAGLSVTGLFIAMMLVQEKRRARKKNS